jgi:hypothetical protein
MNRIILLAMVILLTACIPAQQTIQSAVEKTLAAVPTQTPVIIIKIVTSTFSNTPVYTPQPTDDPLTKTRRDGFYLVNIEIAPGLWHSQGTADKCYWSITTRTDDIINNFYGMAGGTMNIPATAFQVSLEDCGDWVYLGP